jgi:hypothetical protein
LACVVGHTVLNLALPDEDFDEAVLTAQAEFGRHQLDVVARPWGLRGGSPRSSLVWGGFHKFVHQ